MRMFLMWFALLLVGTTWLACDGRGARNNDTSKNVAPSSKNQPVESPLKILSALRTKKFASNNKTWKAKNQEREIVLVVEFAGISSKEWEKVPQEQVYLEGQGQRHDPSILQTVKFVAGGGWELEKVVLVAVVPRNVLEFELHVGSLPMRRLKADTEILAELKM